MQIKDNVIVQSFKEHSEIKKELLDRIYNTKAGKYRAVSHTDWFTGGDVPRTYFSDILEPLVRHYYKNIFKHYYKEQAEHMDLAIDNHWFQIYKKNSTHEWHTHACCNLANVYYVSLPDKKIKTQFINVDGLDIKEGDLVTFPAYYLHTSPINNDDSEKVIISFNTNVSVRKDVFNPTTY